MQDKLADIIATVWVSFLGFVKRNLGANFQQELLIKVQKRILDHYKQEMSDVMEDSSIDAGAVDVNIEEFMDLEDVEWN